MPNKRLFSSPATIALLNGRASAFVIPWKKEVVKTYEIMGLNFVETFFAPCQPGDTVFILETWKILKRYNFFNHVELLIEFKDGDTKIFTVKNDKQWRSLLSTIISRDEKEFRYTIDYYPPRRSPATMPNAACRHVMKVGKVGAVQGKNIVGYMSNNLGFCKKLADYYKECKIAFRQWFIETYPHLDMDSWLWYIEKGI